MMGKKRKHGISLLMPSKNSEKTIEVCIKSFVDFADEIIAVDNGSTDNTIKILEKLEKKIPKMTFYNIPELPDLYQNRQFALEKSNYDWIARFDSDYVAYTSGEYDIKKLRQKILNTKKSIRPIAFGISQVDLFYDIYHTIDRYNNSNSINPVSTLSARIIQYFPFMKFKRLGIIDGYLKNFGRWEGVRFQNLLKHIQLKKPYWFHCEFKSDMAFFYRSERTNWREIGDYKKYPTLDSYIKKIIKEKYNTENVEEACNKYMKMDFLPKLKKYNSDEQYQYPELLKNYFQN